MIFSDFLERIQEQLTQELPFVAYRKPKESNVQSFLQVDSILHKTTEFLESGFVLAPFNLEEMSVLIPSESSELIISDEDTLEEIESRDYSNKSSEIINEVSVKKNHISLVEKGIEAIQENVFSKVVLSREEPVLLTEKNPIQIFKKLLASYPTAFVYVWYHPKVGLWLGATPETLLQIENREFKTMALAGTKVYKGTTDVVWEAKELEEQQIVTNFIVSNLENQLQALKVSKVETAKAGTLLHLKTHISGRINMEASSLTRIIKSLHPTPAVCGMPKEAAKSFIMENEHYKRDFYTGFLGELNLKKEVSRNANRRNVENHAYFSIKTASNLFVNLRCMQIKNNEALLYIGGGITDGSNPIKEWEETVSKSETMKKVLQ
ncbi:chorismate-binding protein [Bizionia myxarmorum]|uniref:Isochorismate synthase n=1 Tax=Bizionia myxarmorum TaxID=291186 RepID=A0A5D0R6V8_9FLAO|nr:chorismate-binding protein [Bizionia myxarmorum]TYB76408.1 isochorismate synthase [Bizionia myxarmorum]